MRYRARDTANTVFLVLGVLAFLVLGSLANYGCREYRIDQCEQSGGQAVVPPWFSKDPAAVACLRQP